MERLETIRTLLARLPLPPGETLPGGASPEALSGFTARTGVQLPEPLQQWLRLSNGPCVGPGGVFGVAVPRAFLDIERFYARYPGWRARGWIPVAGDATGNCYVSVPTRGEHPVAFIDLGDDPERPAYAVASDALQFLAFLFEKELGNPAWPFNAAEVCARDPKLAELLGELPAPWEAC
jgi:hypothetical protein